MKCINNQIFKCFHISHLAEGGNMQCAILYIQNTIVMWKCCVCVWCTVYRFPPARPAIFDGLFGNLRISWWPFQDARVRSPFQFGQINFFEFFIFSWYIYWGCWMYISHCLRVENTAYSIALETEMNTFFLNSLCLENHSEGFRTMDVIEFGAKKSN